MLIPIIGAVAVGSLIYYVIEKSNKKTSAQIPASTTPGIPTNIPSGPQQKPAAASPSPQGNFDPTKPETQVVAANQAAIDSAAAAAVAAAMGPQKPVDTSGIDALNSLLGNSMYQKATINTQKDPLALRDQPSVSGKNLAWMDKGTTFIILDNTSNKDWAYGQYGNFKGYAYKQYLKLQ